MSARRTAGAPAAALVAAALALTAGCGGGGASHGDGKGADHARPPHAGASAPNARGDRKDTGNGEFDEGDPSAGSRPPTVPRARLKPATGSFTKKEKDYLVRRVPEGMEPAAVLEAGETACARIRSTAEVSQKDAVSALKAGEIDQAGPAIAHLCPEFAPLLKAAGKK